jgi:hydrogenase maturation protease
VESEAVTTPQVLVLGIGNLLNADEGVGVHAVRALGTELGQRYPQVAFLDGGTLGLNLLPLVEDATHLLLLDCVDAGQPGGTIVELTKDQIPLYSGVKMSQHQTTFQEVLGLAALRGRLPERLHLIGVQPVSLEIGTQLTPTVEAVLPEVLGRAAARLSRWMTETAPDRACTPNR